uniref:Uncharacterized protein n=1 Tax=Oryza brachyantha TaxID=4533 RepID=J3LPT0_ORYBR
MTAVERDPCPDRILDDVGGAFAMGAVGGTAYHFIKGARNSPNGHRLSGGSQAARMSAPRTAGGFAAWGCLYSAFDCAFVYARRKEDPWNSILAGGATGAVLSLRHGMLASGKAALFGAAILALIEGSGIMITRTMATLPPLPPEDSHNHPAHAAFPWMQPPQPVAVEEVSPPESSAIGWIRGLFGRKEKPAAGDRKSDMLESFDTTSPPMPSFDYRDISDLQIWM